MNKLLIIEDDQKLISAYKLMFSDLYELFITEKGEAGVAKAQEWNPNLILLDLMLVGKMNGFEVLRRLIKNTKTKKIPVIVVSNLDKSEAFSNIRFGSDRYELVKKATVEYLVKANISLETIAEKVKYWMEKNLSN